jgi:hypothetical protein
MKKFILVVLAACAINLVGCEKAGPVERAGERADEIVDNVREGDPPLKNKGPMEKVGESIDEAVSTK